MPSCRFAFAVLLSLLPLASASRAVAQFDPGFASFANGQFVCTRLPDCDLDGSPGQCGAGRTCAPLATPTAGPAPRCTDGSDVFCCVDDGDCPKLDGNAGSCLSVSVLGVPRPSGLCVYRAALQYCVQSQTTPVTLEAARRCVRDIPSSNGGTVLSWREGDCDGDLVPNATDPCPCSIGLGCLDAGVSVPDASVSRDLGVVARDAAASDGAAEGGARDGGSSLDLGGTSGDAGPPVVDAAAPPVDAAGTVEDDAGSSEGGAGSSDYDLGVVPFDADPARGLTFRGAGGCACGVGAGPRGASGLGGGVVLGVLGLLARRGRR